ncbi:Holliday junction branch migration protein RuvA [Catenovulum adriaticum]|uniref:Holliday junction branch migration complex subunit RuvA n=1 Tax=Catenovulum adriaticum TaxID=2984846 RepID=A0ABY7ANR9_9ALTE|nr:Holliday junction branch migration protein RuvA [Catenovulum sp. TS8]WAJ71203.1 Holliday junction branch migration protein RuvA [Catenovulum sp. TS8]
MISRLTGIIVEKLPPECVLDVNGVGYEINLPMTSFYQLAELEQTQTIFIHQVFREDAQALYGFHNRYERDLFRELLKANGVGPKLALAILSAMSAQEFIATVQNEQVSRLVKIPGVGKKTAERLLLEMKDRLAKWQALSGTNQDFTGSVQADVTDFSLNQSHSASQDAVEALLALGYKANQAESAVKKVASNDLSSEHIIRLALKSML